MRFIVNTATFRGVFPRKGRRCARFDTRRGRVWKPLPKGAEIVQAQVRSGGQGYIKGEYLTAESLSQVPEWGRTLVHPRDYRGRVFTLAKDWTCEDWTLGGSRFTMIPAGSRIMYADETYYQTGWYVW